MNGELIPTYFEVYEINSRLKYDDYVNGIGGGYDAIWDTDCGDGVSNKSVFALYFNTRSKRVSSHRLTVNGELYDK